MLISKEVKITWHNFTKKWYISKGYIYTKTGDIFIVKVEDLQRCSEVKIEVLCDYCLENGIKTTIIKMYKDYTFQKNKSPIKKDSCRKCLPKKIKDSYLLRYGVENTSQLSETKEKFKQTCLERYGTNHPMKSEIFLNKSRETCLKKYGTKYYFNTNDFKNKTKNTIINEYGEDNFSKTSDFKNKFKKTCQEKYGCDNTFQVEEFKEKSKITCLNKYGKESYVQTDIYREKHKNTCLKRYGTEHHMQSEEVKNKIKKTCLDRYGVEYAMQNDEIKLRQITSMDNNNNIRGSKQQRYICELVNGKYNYIVEYNSKFSVVDIALINDKIYCEIDGSGHDLSVKHGRKTEGEFKEKEKRRTYALLKSGWKEIRIISKKDLLPSDTIILGMFNNAKELFSNNFHRVVYDIDNGIYKTSKFEDVYNYGELHCIKK
jgi:hypothetical protein